MTADVLNSGFALALHNLVDSSESGSSTGEHVTGLEVLWVETDNVGDTGSMGANNGCDGCGGSEGNRVAHSGGMQRVWIIELKEVFKWWFECGNERAERGDR